MRWLSWVAAVCFVVMTTGAADKKIVCYFGSWSVYRPGAGKFAIEDIDATLCTHYIYTFMGLEKNQVKILDPWQALPDSGGQNGFAKFNDLRNKNPGVKTLVAIGGWGEGSANYSKMASSPNSREIFVNSTVAFVKRYGFDGFDIDWEYPNQRGGKPEDIKNYVTLVKELRTAFDKEDFLLSAAVVGAKNSAIKSYNIREMSKYFDFINVMAYDLHGSWENHTGPNAPLYKGSSDSLSEKELTVDFSIRYWLSQGAPAEKLILGIPLYGQTFTLYDVNENGIGARINGPGEPGPYTKSPGTLGYNEICEMQKKNHWVFHFDEERRVPYIYYKDQWVGYDNVKSVREKAGYINEMGLGGAMVWSVETDDFRGNCGEKYPLIRSIRYVLRNELDE
ncbi:acidic mammalian chitinase-like isoform X2 [Venturia canescens]|nr:acidic mammalian chitinase-like isoform X2 [Venturia canescens]XP_043276971.1 acidic mammalian chitinase-like isoform X2 [Venturia canescens]XP_043276972.1 acidic mammalian chitinase-like isoform X2 [Venturia canescens]XP_043276973.1 acidic mammalian chitinase-like isoform X2 [Venturia canescens]